MNLIKSLAVVGAALGAVLAASYYATVDATDVEPPAKPAESYIKAAQIIEYGRPERLKLQSQVALVLDQRENVILYGREIDTPRPIASLTKLMTALVTLESGVQLDTPVTITSEDRDRLKGTTSRLHFGAILTREDLLRAALGASDNRAASALARTWPGGTAAFVDAMNARAQALGMTNTHYADASGLNPRNVSTARDLIKLLDAARLQPRMHLYTTRGELWVTDLATNRPVEFFNTNRLVRQDNWEIGLSKTGYTADAGNCLVMQVTVDGRPLSIVLLNSWGKLSKYGDARRIRDWLIQTERRVPITAASL